MTQYIAILLAVLSISVASAQTDASTAPTALPLATITTADALAESKDIAERIRSIFSEIESLRRVQVRVSAGVVTLNGIVPNTEDVKRAQAIVSRMVGVVTVENHLQRDVDLTTTLTPTWKQLKTDVKGILSALPLIGVALSIGLLIIALGYLLASVDRLWRWMMPNIFLAEITVTFVRFLSIVFGLIAILEVLGATALLGGVLGGAGVVGIALGFAARDMAGNYVASLMLSVRQPFRANDHVVIEGHEGRVIRLTSRATVLMTLDGNHLHIPNLIVFKSVILNYTRNAVRRFSFELGIDADDDPIDAIAVGLRAINALKFILETPAATAVIQDVGDSNVVLRFNGWIDQNNTDFLKARSLAIQATKSSISNAGFALPEPIYRIRFDENTPPLFGSMPSTAPDDVNRQARLHVAPVTDGDTSPDMHIEHLVIKERESTNKDDLLDNTVPTE